MMENRMNFQTSVELPAGMPSVSHADHILLMGSCFAENIGRQLMDAGFQLDLNPFGILYNPLSVSSALEKCVKIPSIIIFGEAAICAISSADCSVT